MKRPLRPHGTTDLADLNAARPYLRSGLAFLLRLANAASGKLTAPSIPACYNEADQFINQLAADLQPPEDV